jgi:hypothetical protein
MVRLLRVLRYLRRIKLLKDAITASGEPFGIIIVLLFMISLISGTAVFYAE